MGCVRLVLALIAAVGLTLGAAAQIVERPRPAGWERLVPGGRFMDRFEPASVIGNGWTINCWGGDNVKPRDVRNGIEDAAYSYWGGNITKVGREYHLFVARWKESEPRGHMFWPHSEIAHAVSARPDGDFKVVEVLGKGHNPELFRCKDGSWAVYCVNDRKPCQAMLYRAKEIGGPWTYERMLLDLDGKTMIEGESNFSFCARPDGSVLAVCRGGGIWLSEDGLKPFVRKSEGRVYPDVAGRFEDPVLWRDEVQYHIIVNDWLGRVAWKLVSPDGFSWTTLPGEAYTPGIAKTAVGGKIVDNDWFKYERMRVLQDEHGRVIQANFAVIDCAKKYDRGSDIHSSKNITIPMNPGRRVESFRKTRKGWEMRIRSERGFNSLTDVDVESLILGPQSMVAFGAGVKAIGTAEAAGDLVVVFPPVELDSPVVEALGREKSGRLFLATCRTDGTKLAHGIPGAERTEPFAAEVKIENDAWFRGGDDEVVCRQGGGIFRFGDAWYRYGVDYPVAHEFASSSVRTAKGSYDGARVVAFVSRDFAQWEAKGSVIADDEIPPGWLGRMGAAKIGETYAIVIQTALGVSVYTAAAPLGSFRHSHELDFTGITGFKGPGDQTVFADEDTGKYYLVFSKPKGRDRTFVGELGICEDGRIGIVRWKDVFSGWNREANCMFKRGGRYYLCASNIYGWDASLTYWLVGDTPFGPFECAKGADMNVMAGCERDYSHVSQVGFFYTLRGAGGRELVLYYGDRWTQWADNGKGFEVCEPITFDEAGAPRFHSLSSWWLDPKAATWRVADDNNWCPNGSFDADRRLLPLASKPRQEHLTGWNVEVLKGNRIALDNPASPRLNASNSVSDHAFVIGKFALSINDTVPFRRRVSQRISGIPDGEYTLGYMIDEGSGWQRRTETLSATNGECEIVFDRTTTCRIDDVTLTKKGRVQ